MADYQYCIAKNWGKGFIESNESASFKISGYPANIWQVPINNKKANLWIAKVLGTPKTRDEAQTILNTEIDAQQTAWDNNRMIGYSGWQDYGTYWVLAGTRVHPDYRRGGSKGFSGISRKLQNEKMDKMASKPGIGLINNTTLEGTAWADSFKRKCVSIENIAISNCSCNHCLSWIISFLEVEICRIERWEEF